jgi:sensor c-di-GMP phosphodiesterase-like protein
MTFLNNVSKVSVLVSDVATAAEMEQDIQRSKMAFQEIQERLDNLNVELEEWKKQFENLEEKKCLFNEMKNQKDVEISNILHENEEMRKLEENKGSCSSGIKNIGDLSKWQQKRRMQALGTRAQKALWFAKHFGLELDRVEFLDSNGEKHGWSTSSSLDATPPVSPKTPPTAETTLHTTPNHSYSTSSTPTTTSSVTKKSV